MSSDCFCTKERGTRWKLFRITQEQCRLGGNLVNIERCQHILHRCCWENAFTIYLSYQYLVNPHELCFFPGIRVKYFHPAYAFPTPLQCLPMQGSIVLICLCTCPYAYSLVSWFVTFSLCGLCGDGQSGLSLIRVATYSLHLVTYHLSKTYI